MVLARVIMLASVMVLARVMMLTGTQLLLLMLLPLHHRKVPCYSVSQCYGVSPSYLLTHVKSRLGLLSLILKSLIKSLMPKAPVGASIRLLHSKAAADVLDG